MSNKLSRTESSPWEKRKFDEKRDIRRWKKIILDSWAVEFIPETTSVYANNNDTWWMVNIDTLTIEAWDIIKIEDSYDEFIEIYHTPKNSIRVPHTYRMTKEVFCDVFWESEIRILKQRKAQKVEKVEKETSKKVDALLKGKKVKDVVKVNGIIEGVKIKSFQIIEEYSDYVVVQLLDENEEPIIGKRMKISKNIK